MNVGSRGEAAADKKCKRRWNTAFCVNNFLAPIWMPTTGVHTKEKKEKRKKSPVELRVLY